MDRDIYRERIDNAFSNTKSKISFLIGFINMYTFQLFVKIQANIAIVYVFTKIVVAFLCNTKWSRYNASINKLLFSYEL